MPYGEHLARCLHCGKTWIVGDCIPSICDECIAAGHSREGGFFSCLICWPIKTDDTYQQRPAYEG